MSTTLNTPAATSNTLDFSPGQKASARPLRFASYFAPIALALLAMAGSAAVIGSASMFMVNPSDLETIFALYDIYPGLPSWLNYLPQVAPVAVAWQTTKWSAIVVVSVAISPLALALVLGFIAYKIAILLFMLLAVVLHFILTFFRCVFALLNGSGY